VWEEKRMLKMFCGLTQDEEDYLEDAGLCGTLSFKWIYLPYNVNERRAFVNTTMKI
jgi:hypothetical protein